MKLKDWADKQGISYLTAWRWFKAGDPRLANAYQSDSGTIIVPEESVALEPEMTSIQDSDIMAVILKKTVEYSKNQYAIEDFAAWILSNFTLKIKGVSESPKYSRVKPAPEMVQNHFKQFLKPKGEKPKPNMFVTTDAAAFNDLMAKSDDLTAQELVEEIHKIGAEAGASVNVTDAPEVEDLMKDLSSALNNPNLGSINISTYDDIAEGVVTRSVDLTPQQLNYTGSSSPTFSTNSAAAFVASNASVNSLVGNGAYFSGSVMPASTTVLSSTVFQPTQKEITTAARISSSLVEKPRRGRKPSKNVEKK